MAQRVIIGINGELSPFDESLAKLRTPGIGGDSITWVPHNDTLCAALTVRANGTYNADDRNVYGFDYVAVSVPGDSVTGKDPATGQEVVVSKDPDTGEIVETVVPTEIRVITPPTKIIYTHGETIDYSGIVVHAYSSTGQDIGAVPFNQLVFTVTTADAQQSDEWTDGAGLNAMMLAYTPHWLILENVATGEVREYQYYVSKALGTKAGRPAAYGSPDGPATVLATRYNGQNYLSFVSGIVGQNQNMYAYYDGEISGGFKYSGWGGNGSTGGLPSVPGFVIGAWEQYLTDLPESTVNPTRVDPSTVRATQSIPVQWSRTGDGAILETSFNIQVQSA